MRIVRETPDLSGRQSKYPIVKMGNFLTHRSEFIIIDDFTEYKRVRIRLHGKGIVLRDIIEGGRLRTKKQQVVHAGDFLVAEIDAKVGGFGVVPPELDGAIVSSHYFLFTIDQDQCLREWIDWYARSNLLTEQVIARGSTNYAAIRARHVLDFEIPLPPLEEQRRIVAHIEAISARVEEARRLRQEAVEEAESILTSTLQEVFSLLLNEQVPIVKISEIADVIRGRGPEYEAGSNHFVVNQKCIRWNGIKLHHAREASEHWIQRLPPKTFFQNDDVAVNSTGEGTIGRASTVTSNVVGKPFDSHVLAVRPKEKRAYLPAFLKFYIQSPLGQAAIHSIKGAKTTKQTELGVRKLGRLSLPLPPLAEQRRIVAYLDELQARVNELRKYQAETQAALDALMPSVLQDLMGFRET